MRKKISEAWEEVRMAAFLFKTDGFKTNWASVILDDLIEAKNRGVKVEVFLDRQDVSSPFQNPDLARINEQTMRLLKDAGIPVIMDSPAKTTHCKVVVIDRRFVFMGSHNLTKSAFKYNNELSVLIDSPTLAQEISNYPTLIQNENPS